MHRLIVLIVVGGTLLVQAQFVQAQSQQVTGDIHGVVTDPNGMPVSGATVYVVAQGLVLHDITPRSVKTDSNGAFDFRGGFELGTYKLYSRKDADGYPDPLDSFYADAKAEAPKVDLTRDHPSAAATVKLGPQAAVVSGTIFDADTGVPLKASVAFLDAEGHGHSVVADGNYRMVVPPGKEVTLLVRLIGPISVRVLSPIAPLRLEPGQQVYIDIPITNR